MPMPSRDSFIRRAGTQYSLAKVDLSPWELYRDEVLAHWEKIKYPIVLVSDALSYLNAEELRADIKAGRPIKVWEGGRFTFDHPLNTSVSKGVYAYHISRALHDYTAHYEDGFEFSPIDELHAALAARQDFSYKAQKAQWTDDVAMSAYYAHYGKWPTVQAPVIVTPDWRGLQEYLDQ